MNRKLGQLLDDDGVEPVRMLVGNFVTSLEMPGCSVTMLRVDEGMLELVDAPALTPGYRKGM